MSEPPAETLVELLAFQAKSNADSEAVVSFEGRLTYWEWHERAQRVAAGLQAIGVGPGDRVALICENRLAWLEIAMGAMAVGAELHPFNTWARPAELDFLLGQAKPAVVFSIDGIGHQDFVGMLEDLVPEGDRTGDGGLSSARFPSLQQLIIIGERALPGTIGYEDWMSQARVPEDEALDLAQGHGVAFTLYTSGSTSRPKAVPLVHRDLVANGYWIGERQGLGAKDRVLLASPLFWAYGGANALMSSASRGSTLVLQSQFDADEALDLIVAERCTAIYTLPAMTNALLQCESLSAHDLDGLTKGLTIGPPSQVSLAAEELGVSGICNIYGSTETYGNCCVTPSDAPLERRLHSQGPPLPGVEVEIRDATSGAVLSPGSEGEIHVRGRVSPGYDDGTGTLVPLAGPDGFFRTGDIGSLDEDGWLVFRGRSTEMIKSVGINVSPSEVEEQLMEHGAVVTAAVVGRPHEVRGEDIVAFVTLSSGYSVNSEELREYCRQRIASYKVPREFRIVESLPQTSTGKLARKDLKRQAERGS